MVKASELKGLSYSEVGEPPQFTNDKMQREIINAAARVKERIYGKRVVPTKG